MKTIKLKVLLIITLIVLISVSSIAQQDTNVRTLSNIVCNKENKEKVDIKWSWQNPKYSTFERFLVITGATAITAFTDVLLYPVSERSGMVDSYRMIQGAQQLGTSLILAREFGWSTAVGYNVNMLFGVNDGIYYIFNPTEFKNTHFTHLNYTPFYILNGKRLSKHDFKVQIGIGYYISCLLQVIKL